MDDFAQIINICRKPIYEQTFIPKSKRKRIQKKCKKRYTKLIDYTPWGKLSIDSYEVPRDQKIYGGEK